VIIVLLFLVVVGFISTYQYGEEVSNHKIEGKEDSIQPNVSTSIPESVDPDWLSQARELNHRNDWPESLKHALRWNQAQPENAIALRFLGVAYLKTEQPAKAIEPFQQLISIKPEDDDDWNFLGWAYSDNNQTDKAIQAFQQATRINPENSAAWYNLGFVYANNNQTDKAIQAYQQATRSNPENADAWFELGVAYKNMGPGQTSEIMQVHERLKTLDLANADKFFKEVASSPFTNQASTTNTIIPEIDGPELQSQDTPLSEAAFSKTFRCPETLPTDQAREESNRDFTRWALQMENMTSEKFVDLRMRLLDEHHCYKTLANIKSSSAQPNPSKSKQESADSKWMSPAIVLNEKEDRLDAEDLKEYCNSRFEFCLNYPATLGIKPPPANGDGREFYKNDGFKMTVFGSDSVSDTAENIAKTYAEGITSTTYKQSGKGWYALSGYKGDSVLYVKVFTGKVSSNSIIIEYPILTKKENDRLVSLVVKSFKPSIALSPE